MRLRGVARGAVALALLSASWWLLFSPWPDNWDGLGFLASIAHFDLATFSPHAPGYPVYVGLLKLAALITSTSINAARLVGVASGVATFVALWVLFDEPLLAAGVCLVPLVFHTVSGVGSEAPALAFAAIGLACAVRGGRPLLLGAAIGLGVGVRLSWAPFYVPLLLFAARGERLRAGAAMLVSSLIWGIPLAASTGLSRLIPLLRTQASGHFQHWGGTVLRDPERLRFLARDLFVDGFGVDGPVVLGGVIAVGLGALVWMSAVATKAAWRPGAFRFIVVAGLYLVWVTLGQNLRAQPRHVLPLVILLAVWLSRTSKHERFWMVGVVVVAAMTMRSVADARDRRAIPPPGVQVVQYLDHHPFEGTTAVFAGASGRFLEGTRWEESAHAATTAGDVVVALSRMRLPDRVLVTSEVTGLDEMAASRVATFCRPERLDRQMPCIGLFKVDPRATLLR